MNAFYFRAQGITLLPSSHWKLPVHQRFSTSPCSAHGRVVHIPVTESFRNTFKDAHLHFCTYSSGTWALYLHTHKFSYLLMTPINHADETLQLKKRHQQTPKWRCPSLAYYPPTVAGILNMSSSVPG